MSVSGICEICEQAPGVDRCERCGAVVCREHLAASLGYCTSCAAEVRGGAAEEDVDRGEDTFQF